MHPQTQPNTTQVVMDTTGLEYSLRGVANILERIAGKQVHTTETLNESVREQQWGRENSQNVMEDLANASHMSTFQHSLASIPYFDGTGGVDVINWLERIEAACLYAWRDPQTEALGHCSGKVLDSILSVPSSQPWAVLKTTLIRTYSEFKLTAHSCSYLDNMHQEDEEDLRIYIWLYTQAHKMVTSLNPSKM